jgi:hypothetical protein
MPLTSMIQRDCKNRNMPKSSKQVSIIAAAKITEVVAVPVKSLSKPPSAVRTGKPPKYHSQYTPNPGPRLRGSNTSAGREAITGVAAANNRQNICSLRAREIDEFESNSDIAAINGPGLLYLI